MRGCDFGRTEAAAFRVLPRRRSRGGSDQPHPPRLVRGHGVYAAAVLTMGRSSRHEQQQRRARRDDLKDMGGGQRG